MSPPSYSFLAGSVSAVVYNIDRDTSFSTKQRACHQRYTRQTNSTRTGNNQFVYSFVWVRNRLSSSGLEIFSALYSLASHGINSYQYSWVLEEAPIISYENCIMCLYTNRPYSRCHLEASLRSHNILQWGKSVDGAFVIGFFFDFLAVFSVRPLFVDLLLFPVWSYILYFVFQPCQIMHYTLIILLQIPSLMFQVLSVHSSFQKFSHWILYEVSCFLMSLITNCSCNYLFSNYIVHRISSGINCQIKFLSLHTRRSASLYSGNREEDNSYTRVSFERFSDTLEKLWG